MSYAGSHTVWMITAERGTRINTTIRLKPQFSLWLIKDQSSDSCCISPSPSSMPRAPPPLSLCQPVCSSDYLTSVAWNPGSPCCAWCLNPEREERRPPRQCNWQKGEVCYWLEPGPSATSNAVVQVREPLAQAVTQIYRVSTCRWFKQIGYKFAKQFHWSKLSHGWDFPGGFSPFLIS